MLSYLCDPQTHLWCETSQLWSAWRSNLFDPCYTQYITHNLELFFFTSHTCRSLFAVTWTLGVTSRRKLYTLKMQPYSKRTIYNNHLHGIWLQSKQFNTLAEHFLVTINITNNVPMCPDNYTSHEVTTAIVLVNVKASPVMYYISQITGSYVHYTETVVFRLRVEFV